MGSDYIYYYNILYKLGIRANVGFVEEKHRNSWGTHEEAFEDQRWMFHNVTPGEEEKVKDYPYRHLIYQSGNGSCRMTENAIGR